MKVNYQGRQVDATEVDFVIRREDFNEYQLSDGKILRIKAVLIDVYRLEGEVDQEGNPAYQFKHTIVARAK